MNGLEQTISLLGASRPAQAKDAGAIENARARAASEQFESVFLLQMLNSMYAGMSTEGPFGGGQTEAMFRSMLNEEIANEISKSGGIGIGASVYRELLQLQEVLNADSTI